MKKLLVIMLTMLVCVGLFANKVPAPTYELSPTANINGITVPNRDMWDILFTFNASAAASPGTETDGVNIYTTTWNAGNFSRYEMDGTYLGDFTVAGASNIRDMAYDGTYFYGSPASMTIYIMDLANETLIGTIPVTCSGVTGVRHIAYDPELDGGNGGFWVGNWAELGAVTMTGAQIYASMANPGDLYGSAYDPWTDGGPYLWLFSQGGSGAVLYQFDIATLSTTGVTHDATELPGFLAGSIAGGLATYVNDAGVFVMLTNIQQDPNLIGVYEIAITADPTAPGVPTDVVVTPDAGGALSADIDWVCPDIDVAGDPLTDLDEMEVYRDGVLIYTDTNPTIGGAGTYTDVVPASNIYTYTVVGINTAGEGLPVTVTTWVGEDVPNVVTDLLLEDVGGDAYLTWVNPTTGLNGGAFNEMILGYHITRNDGTVFEVTGMVDEWTDTNIPSPDYYSYDVQAYNSVGDGGVSTSNTEWIGDTFSGIVILDLDPTPTGSTLQTSVENFYAGSVVLTSDINAYPLTSDVDAVFVLLGIYSSNYTLTEAEAGPLVTYLNGGGNVYMEGGDTWYFDTPTSLHPYFNINPISDGSSDLSNVDGMDFLTGMTWSYSGENNWIDQLTPIAPAVTVFSNPTVGYDCGIAYDSGTYKTVGTSFEITGLGGTNTLDEAVEGIGNFFNIFGPLPDPGTIEGTITLDGGAGDVEDVEVSAGGETVNPAADGTYSIELQPGTYDVTATLAGYEQMTVEDIVVTEGNATTGVDLTLTYIPTTFDPPINLAVDENNLFTWEAPGTPSGFYEDFEGTFPPDGWLKISPDGGTGWEAITVGTTPLPGWTGGVITACPDGGNQQAFCTYTTGGASSNDQWLVTPQVTVMAGDMLGFWLGTYYADSYADHLDILISTTSQNDPNAFDVVVDALDLTTPDGWTEYSYDLSTFVSAGTPVYIAFREIVADNLNDGAAVSIDNVMVGPSDGIVSDFIAMKPSTGGRDMNYTHIPNTQVVATRDLESYNVYLDGTMQGNTTDTEWQFTGLTAGTTYTAGVVAVYTDGESDMVTVDFVAGGSEAGNVIVAATKLNGNYPNPFNPITNIAYSIKETGNVTIEVYNTKGQLVKTLVNEVKETGDHTVTWNGTDNSNKSVSSGVYFYKMVSESNIGRYTSTKKMILMK